MAGALTVLSQTLQGLVNEGHVLLIDVEAQEAEAPRGAATDTVQELQGLTHKIVVVLVILAAEEVLVRYKKNNKVLTTFNLKSPSLEQTRGYARRSWTLFPPAGPGCGSHTAAEGSEGWAA